jgi:hypothetical protein
MYFVRVNVLLAFGVVFAIVALLAVNLKLQRRNANLAKQEEIYRRYFGEVNSPPPGTHLPELTGAGPTGPWRLNLAGSSKKTAILLFDVDCKSCDQNWEYWDKLIERDISNRILPVATSEKIDSRYLNMHHLAQKRVLVGLDKNLQVLFRLQATPQTIVEHDGIVEKSWAGTLSDSDLKEVESALNQSNQ